MKAWVAIVVMLAAFAGVARADDGGFRAFDPFHVAGVDRRPDAAFPMNLSFRDETGRSVTLAQIADGKPVLLAPVQHHCPNICGFTLDGLAHAVSGQGFTPGRDFQVVAFGFDPRETPADAQASAQRLRNLLPAKDADAVHALVGDKTSVAAAMRGIGYRYGWDPRIQQFAHVAAIAVLTPDGRPARWLYGVQPQGNDLKFALVDAGRGKIGDLGQQLLLLCYHYDPQTGRYNSMVWTLLRVGGVLIIAALGGFILLMALRDRKARRAAA
ncbi:MAG TPA: SCO family protein [Caulobacteraceae bacterium]|jgi:protein SCO1/2|nr:SCO family protein [Caulobacteraceae bacterium]